MALPLSNNEPWRRYESNDGEPAVDAGPRSEIAMRRIFYRAPKWTIVLDDEKIKIMSYTFAYGEKTFVIYLHEDLL